MQDKDSFESSISSNTSPKIRTPFAYKRWNDDEQKKLEHYAKKCLHKKNKINWQQVSENMKGRNARQCMRQYVKLIELGLVVVPEKAKSVTKPKQTRTLRVSEVFESSQKPSIRSVFENGQVENQNFNFQYYSNDLLTTDGYLDFLDFATLME